jgi:oxygen-dependent protoporphyrinogen oxidase
MKRVAVIGGGIAGLASAFYLREIAAAAEFPLAVTVLERHGRPGGALWTIRRGGIIAEAGADSFITDEPDAMDLARRLGLEAEIVGIAQANRGASVVRSGRIIPIPAGFSLMAPSRLMPVMRSPIFTPAGKLRIALEPFVPARRTSSDESLAAFVMRRLGREALERLVQPLAAGIYVGNPKLLSMAACFPRFQEMERRHGSLYHGCRRTRRTNSEAAGVRYGLFASFRSGISTLVERLETQLGEGLLRNAEVTALAKNNGRWRLTLAGGGQVDADAVICAAPAPVAARILAAVAPGASQEIGAIEYASSAVVNLVYKASDLAPDRFGLGIVVPEIERRRIIAISYSSRKFAGRVPADKTLLRAFVGGAMHPEMLDLSDEQLLAAVQQEVGDLLGLRAAPEMTMVTRWPDSMPQYYVGHLERIARIEREVASIENLALAGAALHGVGIPACIRTGAAAAYSIFTALTSSGNSAAIG